MHPCQSEGRSRLHLDEVRRRTSWSQAQAELNRQEAALRHKRQKIKSDLITIGVLTTLLVGAVFGLDKIIG
jgi:hypothetical protein